MESTKKVLIGFHFIILFAAETWSGLILSETPNSSQVGNNATPLGINVNAEMASVPHIECGIQKYSASTGRRRKRIVGGTVTTFGEFPWQSYIRVGGYHCGGALLNENLVISAAHCVYRAKLSDITILLGEYDKKNAYGSWVEPLPKESFSVVDRIIHPEFKDLLTQPDRFDIAILRLDRPVTFKNHILPICLPSKSEDYLGRIGVIAGWGKTDNSIRKTGADILRKVSVPIVSINQCERWLAKKKKRVQLHNEMFCAGEKHGRTDACLGDSGGPIIVLDDGRWTLAGIISGGFGCAQDRRPGNYGIYHNISNTLFWIREQISLNQLKSWPIPNGSGRS